MLGDPARQAHAGGELSPHVGIERLAARSVVFERAYVRRGQLAGELGS